MSFFIPAAMAQSAGGAAPAGTGFEWIFLIGFVVIFYLMIWRPQAKRRLVELAVLDNAPLHTNTTHQAGEKNAAKG